MRKLHMNSSHLVQLQSCQQVMMYFFAAINTDAAIPISEESSWNRLLLNIGYRALKMSSFSGWSALRNYLPLTDHVSQFRRSSSAPSWNVTFSDPLTSAENKPMFRLGVGGAREELDLKIDDARKLSRAEW